MDIIGVNIPIEDAIGNITRIAKLENLCRDMYAAMKRGYMDGDATYYGKRMEQLGLIHETEHDPDTGLKWGEQSE